MMNEERTDAEIAELFASANPVTNGMTTFRRNRANKSATNVSAVLALPDVQFDEGGLAVDFSDPAPAPVEDARRERWWLVTGVAATVALVVSLVVTTTVEDEPPAPAVEPVTTSMTLPERERTSIPLVGAGNDPAGQAAFAIVESAFDAYNAGDMDTWGLWREGGDPDVSGADYAYDLAAESRIDVEQCEYRGLADWRTEPSGPGVSGHGFECEVRLSDVFLRAAGVDLEAIYEWVVAEDLESSVGGSNEDFRVVQSLMGDYRTWLATNHPDVESIVPLDPNPMYLTTAEFVPTAAAYIEDFVAASEDYPLAKPVPPADYYGGRLEPA